MLSCSLDYRVSDVLLNLFQGFVRLLALMLKHDGVCCDGPVLVWM
jgi:hypothetical protein